MSLFVTLLGLWSATDWYVFQMDRCNDTVVVHGLWPQWGEWCAGAPFDPAALAPIAARLEKDWPSCVGPHPNATAFHAHEWLKHGACTPYTELEYFSHTLALYDTYKATGHTRVCLNHGLLPIHCPT